MSQIWGPTAPGKLFTQTTEWKLALAAEQFLLQAGSQKVNGGVREIERLYVVPGRFWTTVTVPLPGGQTLRLDGIPNTAAKEMAAAISKSIRRISPVRNSSFGLQLRFPTGKSRNMYHMSYIRANTQPSVSDTGS